MINYIKGDIFKTNADIIVYPVSCKGETIYKEFKEQFPIATKAYIRYCKDNKPEPGMIFRHLETTILGLDYKQLREVWFTNIRKTKKSKPTIYNRTEWRYECLYSIFWKLYHIKKKGIINIPPIDCKDEESFELFKKQIENADKSFHLTEDPNIIINVFNPF